MLLTVYAGAEAYSRTLTSIDQRRICPEVKNKGSELKREDANRIRTRPEQKRKAWREARGIGERTRRRSGGLSDTTSELYLQVLSFPTRTLPSQVAYLAKPSD